ncbi:NADP-dependent malic enzyme [Hibiscus syriacus]|uniref:NADP-dependent malic enzyme n=1 Tax=Hibiscus syriacus TaxID=106335 RepID=A0A6A2XDT2_HIBSY|nr:NADP-dependent malic enzyme [Hibiscus syriacus]
MMDIIRQYTVPLHRYMAMVDLQERNERLFYKLLIDNVEELLPVVYTPTVGEACQKYGSIFKHPQGLYNSLKKKYGMGIPVGKLSLYTALGGVCTSLCLPITIDAGTNNEKLFYIGLRQKRATGKEYADQLQEFMYAVKQNYGEKILIQFEDFANHSAFELLARYSSTHLVFNDDIQVMFLTRIPSSVFFNGGEISLVSRNFLSYGNSSIMIGYIICGSGGDSFIPEIIGGTLADHTFLFLGAGEAGTGIADLISLEISEQESLQDFKKPWANEHGPVTELINAVNPIKPTILIGTSGIGKQFTKEVVEAMASLNKANNAYIFPGFGLGLIISGSIRVRDAMLLEGSKALASQVTEENFEKGMIYPLFKNIRKISANIAAKVAAKFSISIYLHCLMVADARSGFSSSPAEDLVKSAEKCMYSTVYRSYL